MPNLYGLPTESHSSLNQRAHPGGGVETIAVQSGEGLVEDQYEAHLKGLYVAYREATAGKIAALAVKLEEDGFSELAEGVDEVLAGFYEAGLVKTAVSINLHLENWPRGWINVLSGIDTDVNDAIRSIEFWKDDDDVALVGGTRVADAAIRDLRKLENIAANINKTTSQLHSSPDATKADYLGKLEKDATATLESAKSKLRDIEEKTDPGGAWFAYGETKSAIKNLDVHVAKLSNLIYDALNPGSDGTEDSTEKPEVEPAQEAAQTQETASISRSKTVTPPQQPAQQVDQWAGSMWLIGTNEAVADLQGLHAEIQQMELDPQMEEQIRKNLMTPDFMRSMNTLMRLPTMLTSDNPKERLPYSTRNAQRVAGWIEDANQHLSRFDAELDKLKQAPKVQ